MLNSLTTYLASLPPILTVAILAFSPWFAALAFAFTFKHAMDVASAKVWGR